MKSILKPSTGGGIDPNDFTKTTIKSYALKVCGHKYCCMCNSRIVPDLFLCWSLLNMT